jgi:hypothetical protein
MPIRNKTDGRYLTPPKPSNKLANLLNSRGGVGELIGAVGVMRCVVLAMSNI